MAELVGGEEEPQTAKGEDDLDPRVKEELDCLNSTAEEINKLEIELDHARTKFRSLLTEATQRLNVLYKKLGRPVTKARPYYELLKESKKAQGEAQRAVVKFHRANGIYRAAKETVALAEERLMSMGDNGEKREFDAAWQEMLNHATMKFMDSEKDKTLSEQEHYKRAGEVAEIQKKLKTMEKSMPRTIPRSRPYFELKERLEFQLQQEKLNVEDLVRALQLAKVRYRSALEALEAISEEVHMKRKMATMLPPRTPGVGAENLNDVNSDLPSINLDLSSESAGDVISINSDDFDAMSTDGSEMGDDSPRLEPRSISLPVSPLARDNSSPSFTRARSAAVRAQQAANLSDSVVESGLPRDALRIPPHGQKSCPQYVESSPTLLEQADRLAHSNSGSSSTCSSQPTGNPELNGESGSDLSASRTLPSKTPDSLGDGVEAGVKSVQNGLESCVLAEGPTEKNGIERQPDKLEQVQANGMDPLGVVNLDNTGTC